MYVDALGTIDKYQQYLSSTFPTIPSITVATKADSKYKIVGAASIAAKVTRDRCLDDWAFEELPEPVASTEEEATGEEEEKEEKEEEEEGESGPRYRWNTEYGSGYPSGMFSSYFTAIPHSRAIVPGQIPTRKPGSKPP